MSNKDYGKKWHPQCKTRTCPVCWCTHLARTSLVFDTAIFTPSNGHLYLIQWSPSVSASRHRSYLIQRFLRRPTFTTWSWYSDSDLPRHSDLCLHRCQFVLPLSSAFFSGSWILFKMGVLNSLNSLFKFSHITEASVPEFVIDGHYYTSPNQQEEPPTISFEHSKELHKDALPYELRGRVWALNNHPYLPFMLFSPFRGAMTSRLSTPPEQISLDEDAFGFHLPQDVSKSWKTLEQSCLQIITVLHDFFKTQHPTVFLVCSDPPKPSEFGYSKCYRTKVKARLALSTSLDAFVLLFAYVSFYIAICRSSDDLACISSSSSTSMQPRWFPWQSRIHPESQS